MKKISVIAIAIFFLAGCSSEDNDFAYKESCAKYVKDVGGGYSGTSYSKGKKTCISVYRPFYDSDPSRNEMNYYNEFTGEWRVFDRKNIEEEKQRLEFEKELQLTW